MIKVQFEIKVFDQKKYKAFYLCLGNVIAEMFETVSQHLKISRYYRIYRNIFTVKTHSVLASQIKTRWAAAWICTDANISMLTSHH